MAEVNASYGGEDSTTVLHSLPPVIWAELSHNLQPLLTFRTGMDHSLVLRWSHRALREMAEASYLTHYGTKVQNDDTKLCTYNGRCMKRCVLCPETVLKFNMLGLWHDGRLLWWHKIREERDRIRSG